MTAGSRWVRARVIFYAMVACTLLTAVAPQVAAAADDPEHINFTLEGCRLATTGSLPNGNGDFVCDDAEYTTGNLGKNWNELDLVPYRLTAQNNNGAQTYAVAITADREEAGAPGYDVISVPVLNTSLSSGTCQLSAGSQQNLTPGIGGIDTSIYRILTITQSAGSVCVFDYYERLALGSHLFPGASLHSNLMNQNFGTAGIGARDVSIPVNEILPQELSKTMAAQQGSSNVWNVTKDSSPADLNFTNTCGSASSRQAGVTITVRWTKSAPAPNGDITITTNITLTNPAHRTINADVTDVIYTGNSGTNEAVETSGQNPRTFTNVAVPPSSTHTLTHTITVAAGSATSFHDVATATYTDSVTGVAVPGNTTATASATVQLTSADNSTATITDVEQITGTGLTFSADSVDGAPAGSSFSGGYVLGTQTTGPLTWTSGTVSGNGQVVFHKTVYVDQPRNTTGTLSDTATLTEATGSHAAAASTTITARACIQGQKFEDVDGDHVKDPGEPGLPGFTIYVDLDNDGQHDPNEPSAITDAAGNYTITGVPNGTWTVREVVPAGWVCTFPVNCAYSVTVGPGGSITGRNFGNARVASLGGVKFEDLDGDHVRDPGEPLLSGWTFYLDLNNNNAFDLGEPTSVTNAGGEYLFSGLAPGTYTVRELLQGGWECSAPSAAFANCEYSVELWSAENDTSGQDFGNLRRASVSGVKYEDLNADGDRDANDPGVQGFTIYVDLDNDNQFDPGEPSTTTGANGAWTIGGLLPGTYTIREVQQNGWTCSAPAANPADCEFVVTLTSGQSDTTGQAFGNFRGAMIVVDKVTVPAGDPQAFPFSSSASGHETFSLTDAAQAHQIPVNPGTYTVSETDIDGWRFEGITCDLGPPSNRSARAAATTDGTTATITVDSGDTVTCTWRNVKILAAINVEKSGPAFAYHGDQVTFTYHVTNTGNSPLHDVVVTDDKCSPVTGPIQKINDDGDNLLEPGGEVWVYTCTKTLGAHQAGEQDPLVNTATATGKDEENHSVNDTDTHSTNLLHPAIALDKSGPAEAEAGQTIGYTLTVTNPGDTAIVGEKLAFDDPLCEAPPLLQDKRRGDGSDPTPATLDPGDTWVYLCNVPTQAGQSEVVNTATVKGVDINNRPVQATDDARTVLAQVQVLPTVVRSGFARLAAPTACVSRTFRMTVTGRSITSITVLVDGRRARFLRTTPRSGQRYSIGIDARRYRRGTHTVTVRTTFEGSTNTRTRTFRAVLARCQAVKPKFTG